MSRKLTIPRPRPMQSPRPVSGSRTQHAHGQADDADDERTRAWSASTPGPGPAVRSSRTATSCGHAPARRPEAAVSIDAQVYRPNALNPIITADTIPKARPANVSHGVVPSHESNRYPRAPAMTTLSAMAVPTQKKSPNEGVGVGFSGCFPGSWRGGPAIRGVHGAHPTGRACRSSLNRRMRLLPLYAVRGAPKSSVRHTGAAARSEARWTGYTG